MTRNKASPKKKAAAVALNDRERMFVAEYLKDLNQTQAAIRAGYAPKSARQQASRLMTKAYIADAIAAGVGQREEKVLSDGEWLLKRLREEAEADIADLYDDNGNFKPVKEWPAIWRKGLITGIDVEQQQQREKDDESESTVSTVFKVRYADRLRRLELMGRHTNVQAWNNKVVHDLTDPIQQLAQQILGNSIKPKEDDAAPAAPHNPMVRE